MNNTINITQFLQDPILQECPVCTVPLDTYTASTLFWWLLGISVTLHLFNLFLFDYVIQHNKYKNWVRRYFIAISFILSVLTLNLYFYL